jgi:hypothetical protein
MVRAWLCLLLLGGAARAEGRLGLVNLRFVDVGDQDRRDWRDAIQGSVEGRGLQLISDANLHYVQSTSRELFDCFTEDRCRTEIGRRLQADLLLSGQISREKDELLANLSLFAVDLQMAVKNQVVHCPGCAPAVFRDRLVEAVNDLIISDRGLSRATLLVRTIPPEAAVRVDGRPAGIGELEVIVTAGRHKLQATHQNHDPLLVDVEVKPGERLPVELKLPPRTAHVAVIAPVKTSWWTMRRIAGVTMLAVGAAGIIAGAPLIAISGSCADNICYNFHNDKAAGGALVGLGTALMAVGGLVLLTSPSASVQATLGPGSIGASGAVRF